MSIPPECWLHALVEVRRSGIEGHGLFAREPLAEGEVVERHGGRLLGDAELAAPAPPDAGSW